MLPWPTRSVERWVPAILTGIGVALAAVTARRATTDVRVWLPDVAVGAVLLAAGALTVGRSRTSGILLSLTGGAWFVDTLTEAFEFLHRGPLVHLLLTGPVSMRAGRRDAIAVGYVAAAFWPVWADPVIAIVLALAIAAIGSTLHGRAGSGAERSSGRAAVISFSGVVVVCTLALTLGNPSWNAAVVHVYEFTIASIAVVIAGGAIIRHTATIPDLVVDLGEPSATGLQRAFAEALGDPTLELGYWTVDPSTGAGRYVSPDGRELRTSPGDAGRKCTYVGRSGGPLAVLIHDAAVLDDARVVDSVAAATRLHDANDALTQALAVRIDEIVASRRRLVVAGDRGRQRLQHRLDAAVTQRIIETERQITDLVSRSDHLRLAAEHLARTRDDLELLSRGLHPRDLDHGLGAAVNALVQACPLPVHVVVDVETDATGDVAAAAYFVCAEALSNVVKHSGSDDATITLRATDGRLSVAVSDRGIGGADPNGSGLRGLADRVDAFGGRFQVSSGPAGTCVAAEFPLEVLVR